MSRGAVTEAVAKQQRMMELEKKLAYEAARGDISCFCVGHLEGEKQWFASKVQAFHAEADITQPDVDVAIEYLELRGLLMHHLSKPWVHIKEMPR